MYGRYRLSHAERFAEINHLRQEAAFPARYNIAPTQEIPVVYAEAPNILSRARWGLIPSWAKEAKIASSLINARAETVASKPAFRAAFRKRHCLVPADGFYEWQKLDRVKIPHHITMQDGEPYAFAGLWEICRAPGEPDAALLRTCTILTINANALVAPIHNRMPVILPRSRYADWLSPKIVGEEREAMLVPFPAEMMSAHPISTRVNSPPNDDPQLLNSA